MNHIPELKTLVDSQYKQVNEAYAEICLEERRTKETIGVCLLDIKCLISALDLLQDKIKEIKWEQNNSAIL